VRFSHRAMQSALLITLYQDEPILHQASRLLRAIVDIDELSEYAAKYLKNRSLIILRGV
jgi:hypothetical protein